jgi:RNA polymerase sigma factor (sigma-70 family)
MTDSATTTSDPLPTRMTLLSRVRDIGDHQSWREFQNLYAKLIREVIVRAGVRESDIEEVAQETLVSIAEQMPGFRYEPKRGSFKAWLRTITRRRIADHFRRIYREPTLAPQELIPESEPALDAAAEAAFDDAWEDEWKRHMLTRALARISGAITVRDRQVFDLAIIRSWPSADVRKATGVSLAHLYVIRHRIGKLVKKEIEVLKTELE